MACLLSDQLSGCCLHSFTHMTAAGKVDAASWLDNLHLAMPGVSVGTGCSELAMAACPEACVY